ncbi:MAG: CDP-alcohol phosphatidyltransferase family protein [Spirochaetia bacterium]|jgi:phosphatidylglycerophosphate synthase|nr:CDP-alcohol phosphatidyltransferase family protein [Spirochaetia bacterium]
MVDKLLRHWWRLAFRFVPARMSANLLSMLGNLGSWLAVSLLMLSGYVDAGIRSWLFGLAALGIILYHTLDCLDGMQARRIGSAGPLGEFVDHWFDSMNVFFFPLGIVAAFPGIPAWVGIFLIIACMMVDWITLREVDKTNRLYFWHVSTEEAIVIYWMLLLSMAFGAYDFWALPHPALGFPPISVLVVFVALAYILSFATTIIRLRFEGFRELVIEFLSVSPVAVWILVASRGPYPRVSLFIGLAAIGFIGSRHIGDLLRTRLVGLAYPLWYPDLVAGSAVVLMTAFMKLVFPELPYWLFVLPVLLLQGFTFCQLGLQFARTIKRVKDYLGISLFHVPEPAGKLADR